MVAIVICPFQMMRVVLKPWDKDGKSNTAKYRIDSAW